MKLSALVVCLGTMAMAVAAATSFRVTLFENAVVAGTELKPGADFQGGTVVDIAPSGSGSELLAVVPIAE